MLRVIMINELPFGRIAEIIKESKELKLAGVVTELESAGSYQSNGVPVFPMDQMDAYAPDLILSFHFSRKIPAVVYEKYLTVNVHAGILPKWRGFSCNAWAVINGEKEVGYSVHRVSAEFDAGDIYRIYKEPIADTQAYLDIREKFEARLLQDLEQLLVGIYRGTVVPISQQGQPHVYTVRLHPSDGYLASWDKKNDFIFGIYHFMAKSMGGTGVYFRVKGEWIEVTKMSRCPAYENYLCVPGAVVGLTDSGSAIVKTQDSVLSIDEIKKNDVPCRPAELLRIGTRLDPAYP